jgi:N-acyl-L-homoserine lactone synthetase
MSGAPLLSGTFADRLFECRNRVEYRLVRNEADLDAVYELRYDAYVREGIIPISPERRFTDAYDQTPNVWIFGVYLDGRLASSIRVHVATPRCPISPSVDVFPDLLRPAVEQGQTIVDPTRFVADREMARRHPELPYITVRLGFLASERFRADLGLASVRSEHQAFYKRLFYLQPLCEPRTFPNLTATFSLMGVNYLSVKERIIARYPFMQTTPDELEQLFGQSDSGLRGAAPGIGSAQEPFPANDLMAALSLSDVRRAANVRS